MIMKIRQRTFDTFAVFFAFDRRVELCSPEIIGNKCVINGRPQVAHTVEFIEVLIKSRRL